MANLANLSSCAVCIARGGERHSRRCPVPSQAARALSHVARVETYRDDPDDLRDLAAALEACNARALRAWLREGRAL